MSKASQYPKVLLSDEPWYKFGKLRGWSTIEEIQIAKEAKKKIQEELKRIEEKNREEEEKRKRDEEAKKKKEEEEKRNREEEAKKKEEEEDKRNREEEAEKKRNREEKEDTGATDQTEIQDLIWANMSQSLDLSSSNVTYNVINNEESGVETSTPVQKSGII
jgi:hypothetical protein